jgi:hypothetical protein
MIIAAIAGVAIAIPAYLVVFRKKIRGFFNARRKKDTGNTKRSGEL